MNIKVILLVLCIAGALSVVLIPWSGSHRRNVVEQVAQLNGQWVGRKAPAFTLKDLKGKEHSLSDYRGKVVFLNFWASFCTPCKEEMPSMERLVRQYKDRGLVMIAISFDPEAAASQAFMDQFLPGEQSAMTILHDPQSTMGQAYGTELIPETYIIDQQGEIVARFVNAYDWARPEVKGLIESLLTQSGPSGLSKPLL